MNDITTLKKSFLMIQKLKKRLQEQKDSLYEPVAIVGMSCRLPQANNLHQFWDSLCQGQNQISSIPDERWELLKGSNESAQRDPQLDYWSGYLKDIDVFDAYFFGISPREAMRMDPQQRILLEVCYESLEDAGLPIDAVAGSSMGVFSSLYASQFSHLQQLDSDMDALLIPTGSAISIAANRLSYLLDLHGPSITLDTACSSSLIAVQLACLNLQAKTCDTAIVSAVNINLLPSIHSILSKATMLSPTGQCHTFDAKADGYVQGEGAGAIVLKPLSKALEDKDRIYAVITGSAVNQDGRTNGLTAPNGLQQEQLLQSAYRAAKVNPADISYIECHGTGTFLGDPIEVQALGEVVGKNRVAEKPCWISSVKTNVGHLEPAAGIISMIKTALVLSHKMIPPHLNFTAANPHIPFDKYSLTIPKKMEPLPRYSDVSVAGVSGFGFGGANAHIVLRETSLAEQPVSSPSDTQESELFTLSARDSKALNDFIGLWCDYLQSNPDMQLGQICYNLHLRRAHHPYRLAIVTDSITDLLQKLSLLRANQTGEHQDVWINREMKKAGQTKKISDFDAVDSSTLAGYYTNNASVDWIRYEAERFYAPIDMPLYPWQHKKYWPVFASHSNESEQSSYPMRGKVVSSPLQTRQFEFHFDTKTMPEIKDTFHVLHAGYYTEMLAFAIRALEKTEYFSINKLSFLSPLIVMDEKTVSVQLIMEPNEDQSYSLCFYSNDGKNNWIEHAKGTAFYQKPSSYSPEINIKKIKGSKFSGTADNFYARITGMGMPAGDTIRWTEHYWVNDRELLSELRHAEKKERVEQFELKMHPGIIDACIQTLFLMLPEHLTKPYIASHMGTIEFHSSMNEPKFIYTVLKELETEGKSIIGDWYLLDKNLAVIAKCQDLCMTQLADSMQIDKIMGIQSEFKLDLSLTPEECKATLTDYLKEQFAAVFSMPVADINTQQSLHELGMDSLMALAVMRIIETNVGVTYSLPLMMKGPSISEIVEYVLDNQSFKAVNELTVKPTPNRKDSLWIANRTIQKNAKVRLFCFPYGGGGASIYREWQQDFPDFIEVCPIQLPGRENRMEEQPFDNIDTLVALLAKHLEPEFNLPFAFFGHSFGSLIGFELARYLRRNHLPQPVQLFASAYPDPRQPSRSLDNLLARLKERGIHLFDLNQEQIQSMDEEQLNALSAIFKENGIVDYSDERINKSIIQVLLPIFIGDMNSVKNYRYQDELPFEQKITVFLGRQDTWVAPKDHKGWVDHSQAQCDFQEFDSGHLFIRETEYRLKVITKITEDLMSYSQMLCEV